MRLEILDTTLRDGEQTSGVAFASDEKLSIARQLLEDVRVDRIEVASARVSTGEFNGVERIAEWASKNNRLHQIEVLGFVDNGASVDWIKKSGCKVMNLLAKGSLKHCVGQLGKKPEEHISDIKENIRIAQENGIEVNLYLEDWSNGVLHSPEYVYFMVDELKDTPIKRFMLPDTLGILSPYQTFSLCYRMTKRYPGLHFDFHAHNDYDLAVANVFAAAKVGVKGIHCTVNGLGERAGNASLSSVIPVIHDLLQYKTNVNEKKINNVSHLVESYSGVRISANSPIVGENVFTQCAGVHADGDSKNNLYYNDLLPERFGRTREYALGKTSGKANIVKNLDALGISLDDDSMKKVTNRIIELGDKKEIVTPDDLPYIISDVLHHQTVEQKVKILNYSLSLAQGLKPVATLKIEINSKVYQKTSSGDGQYDAFMKALRGIYKDELHRDFPLLTNYVVTIPPGGRTDAFVQTLITWNYKDEVFKTRGLDADQTEAAILATIKMLNKIEDNY
ncbi:MAG: alpha-isopropylmalate synthase regulatory domain-containing protein [Bacteroidales bacterium]|nr:alpha-isopropylmalate synthase regulatory domain-containing protein [Bacteroidales bacterium]